MVADTRIKMKVQHVLIPSFDRFFLSCSLYRVDSPRAVVQIIHGASEYKGRYDRVARVLQEAGFAVLVSDQRGHGESVDAHFVRGFMPSVEVLVEDQWIITQFLQKEYPKVPIALLSHSFGANIARYYLSAHDASVYALMMSGAPVYVRGNGLAMWILRVGMRIFSPHWCPPFTSKLTTSASLKWVCSDPAVIEERRIDPYRKNFRYALASIHTVFDSTRRLHRWSEYRVENPNLPILFLSGSEDPIPGGRIGLFDSVHALKKIGYTNVSSIIFEKMRHEVLMEREKERVFAMIISFLDDHLSGERSLSEGE